MVKGANSVMMSMEDVAERWGVDRRTIRRAIDRKQIVALRVGRSILIARSHIEYLEQSGTGFKGG